MKTKEQILEMIKKFETRIKFIEDMRINGNQTLNPNMPDSLEECASKIMALKWVIDEVDDLFAYPLTLKSLNQEKFCMNLLNEIKEETEQ